MNKNFSNFKNYNPRLISAKKSESRNYFFELYKVLSILLFAVLFLFSSIILTSCWDEYWNYHNKKELTQKQLINTTKQEFNISKITEEDLEIVQTPNKEVLEKIISQINLAKEKINLEVYIFTEKRILKSLIDAHKKWVKINVILEKNVYWAWNINKDTFESLKNAWIKVSYASEKNYNFTHSKFITIDDKFIIWTGNFSYSSFVNNKEIFVFWKNPRLLTLLNDIFQKDLINEKYLICDDTMVISPICPRLQFTKTLMSAKKEILIFAQTFDDIEIISILKEKIKQGVKIKILLWDVLKIKWNEIFINEMKKNWIQVISPKKPYIHAKSFLVDWEFLYIGSINFSTNSINNNREIWLIFKNKDLIKQYKTEFETLFTKLQ